MSLSFLQLKTLEENLDRQQEDYIDVASKLADSCVAAESCIDLAVENAFKNIFEFQRTMKRKLRDAFVLSQNLIKDQEAKVSGLAGETTEIIKQYKAGDLDEVTISGSLAVIEKDVSSLIPIFKILESLNFETDKNSLYTFANPSPDLASTRTALNPADIQLHVLTAESAMIKLSLKYNDSDCFKMWLDVEVSITKSDNVLFSEPVVECFRKGLARFICFNEIEICVLPDSNGDWIDEVLVDVTVRKTKVVATPMKIYLQRAPMDLNPDHVSDFNEKPLSMNSSSSSSVEVQSILPSWDDSNYEELMLERNLRKSDADLSISKLRLANTFHLADGHLPKAPLPQSIAHAFDDVTFVTDIVNNKIHVFKGSHHSGFFPDQEKEFDAPRYIATKDHFPDPSEKEYDQEGNTSAVDVLILDNRGLHVYVYYETNFGHQRPPSHRLSLFKGFGYKYRGLAVNTDNWDIYTTEKVDGIGVYLVTICLESNKPRQIKVLLDPTSNSAEAVESSACKYLAYADGKVYITDMGQNCFYIHHLHPRSPKRSSKPKDPANLDGAGDSVECSVNSTTIMEETEDIEPPAELYLKTETILLPSGGVAQGITVDVGGNIVVASHGKNAQLNFFGRKPPHLLLRAVAGIEGLQKMSGLALSGKSLFIANVQDRTIKVYTLEKITYCVDLPSLINELSWED